jgi:hypothetical protein
MDANTVQMFQALMEANRVASAEAAAAALTAQATQLTQIMNGMQLMYQQLNAGGVAAGQQQLREIGFGISYSINQVLFFHSTGRSPHGETGRISCGCP